MKMAIFEEAASAGNGEENINISKQHQYRKEIWRNGEICEIMAQLDNGNIIEAAMKKLKANGLLLGSFSVCLCVSTHVCEKSGHRCLLVWFV
jgi:hypothetical protein